MGVFIKALIKSLFGDLANTASVAGIILVGAVLDKIGDGALSGWVMAGLLLTALMWLSRRYG